jgi:hypothetical protein
MPPGSGLVNSKRFNWFAKAEPGHLVKEVSFKSKISWRQQHGWCNQSCAKGQLAVPAVGANKNNKACVNNKAPLLRALLLDATITDLALTGGVPAHSIFLQQQ